MWGYRSNWDFEDWGHDLAMGVVIGLMMLITAVLITIIIAICTEIARVHQRLWGTNQMRWLTLADGAMLVVLLIGAGLALTPGTGALAAYFSAWGFLVYVVVIEFLALQAADEQPASGDLDTYLGPFTISEPSHNGQGGVPAKV